MQNDVWLVIAEWGQWSDYGCWVESIWDTDAGAICHIMQDIGATFEDAHRSSDPENDPISRFSWIEADEEGWDDTYYHIEHRKLHHGERGLKGKRP